MGKIKVFILVNGIRRAQEHEWFVDMINRDRFQIEFGLINSEGTYMDDFLKSRNVKVHHFNCSGKKDMPLLTWKLFRLFRKERFDVVHTHLLISSLSGLLAALLAGVPQRIITRHHSDYHHKYFPSVVKYDKMVNKMATQVVAITQNVYTILTEWEGVSTDKVVLIHHGLDLKEYRPDAVTKERISVVRQKYQLDQAYPVIGVISRFIYWKGVQYIIPAFSEFLVDHPEAVLVLANANGVYKNELIEVLKVLPPKSYRLIEFENDIAALYRSFHCFIHVPIDRMSEAFGQTYIESLASKVPSIFTKSGIACEFAKDHVNCLVVPYKDSQSILKAMETVFSNSFDISGMIEAGYREINDNFSVSKKIQKLEALYSK